MLRVGVESRPMTPGQALIDEGHYEQALREFTSSIEAEPTEADGYRGRAEAFLMLGRFADAYHDYYAGISALVLPVRPDAPNTIVSEYAERLSADPLSIPALTGASFAQWVFFDYSSAILLLDQLLAVRPDDVFGTLFRGSAQVLGGLSTVLGAADLERAMRARPRKRRRPLHRCRRIHLRQPGPRASVRRGVDRPGPRPRHASCARDPRVRPSGVWE